MRRVDQQEQPFIHLQQLFRHADRKNLPLFNAHKKTLLWQSAKYQRLKQEREEIDLLLMLHRSYSASPKDMANQKKLLEVTEAYDHVKSLYMNSEDDGMLDKLIDERRARARELRSDFQSGMEIATALRKKVFTMENRLQTKTVEFGKQRAELGRMRNELYSMQKRVDMYLEMYSNLSDVHDELRSKMQGFVLNCIKANREKEDNNAKIASLKELIAQNDLQHRFDMNETDRHSYQMYNFEEFDSMLVQERGWYSQAIYLEEAEKELVSKREQLRRFEQAFSMISNRTDNGEMKIIVDKLKDKIEDNFALFRYLVEINTEIGNLSKEINLMLPQVRKAKNAGVQRQAEQRKVLQSIRAKTTAITAESERESEKTELSIKELATFKEGLITVMRTLGSDTSSLEAVTGVLESEDVVLGCLQEIQTKTNEIYLLKFLYDRATKPKSTLLPAAPSYRTHHTKVLPPAVVYYE